MGLLKKGLCRHISLYLYCQKFLQKDSFVPFDDVGKLILWVRVSN